MAFTDAESSSVPRPSMSGRSGVCKWSLTMVQKPAAGIWTQALLLTRQPFQPTESRSRESIALTSFLGWSREEWEAAWVEGAVAEVGGWLGRKSADYPAFRVTCLTPAQQHQWPFLCLLCPLLSLSVSLTFASPVIKKVKCLRNPHSLTTHYFLLF